jgi:hypothetical protein
VPRRSTQGSAAREHTILRISRLSRKNEHVSLTVVCPHHCSNQRIQRNDLWWSLRVYAVNLRRLVVLGRTRRDEAWVLA